MQIDILNYMKEKAELNQLDKKRLLALNTSHPLLKNAIENKQNTTIEQIAGEYFVYFNNEGIINIVSKERQQEFLKPIKTKKEIEFNYNEGHNLGLTDDDILARTDNIENIQKILKHELIKSVINTRNILNKKEVQITIKDYGTITLNKQYFNYIKKQKIKEIYTIGLYPAPITFKCADNNYYCIAHIYGGD